MDENTASTTSQTPETSQAPTSQSTPEALKDCQTQLNAWKERYMRLTADFDNYKKRIEKEQAYWELRLYTKVFTDILNIMDNFERALADYRKRVPSSDQDVSLTGLEMIEKEFSRMLDKFDIQEIKATGQFNPELHEAISQVASETHKPGEIVDVLQKGYRYKDEVLRPARVSIAQ